MDNQKIFIGIGLIALGVYLWRQSNKFNRPCCVVSGLVNKTPAQANTIFSQPSDQVQMYANTPTVSEDDVLAPTRVG